MPDTPYEDVQIEGHLIDSLMMPHIMDQIMDLDGEFEMLTFEVGRMKDDPSHAVMRIFGRDARTSTTCCGHRAVRRPGHQAADVELEGCRHGRRLPRWLLLHHQPRDLHSGRRPLGARAAPRDGLRRARRPTAGTAETVPLNEVRAGDLFVTGHGGIRVVPLARPREGQPFEFMASAVSSEKPKARSSARWPASCAGQPAGKLTSPCSAPPSCTPGRRRPGPPRRAG